MEDGRAALVLADEHAHDLGLVSAEASVLDAELSDAQRQAGVVHNPVRRVHREGAHAAVREGVLDAHLERVAERVVQWHLLWEHLVLVVLGWHLQGSARARQRSREAMEGSWTAREGLRAMGG